MRKLRSQLVIGAVLLAAMMTFEVATASPSFACDIADPFVIRNDHLTSEDFGEPDAQIAADFREFTRDDDAAMPELRGAFLVETVHVETPQDGWSQGGIDTVVKVWGGVPDDLGPFLNRSVDLDEVANGSCDYPNDSDLGRQVHRLLDADGDTGEWFMFETRDETLDAALAVAFGEPKRVARNIGAEEAMIGELKNDRAAPGPGVAIGFGAIVVIAGVLSYWYREKKVHTAWAQVLAEREAEEKAAQTTEPLA